MRRTRWGLGPLGDIADIIPPQPGMNLTSEQTTQTAQPLDGPPVVYRSAAAARIWSLEYTGRSPFEMASLVQMARHPGPLYLLDPITCQTNMLAAHVAEPGMMLRHNGEDVLGWQPRGDGRVLAAGTAYETSLITNGTFEDSSYWVDALAALERDDQAHWWTTSTLASNSGERSLRAQFLAAAPAWQALHPMVEVPVSRRVRVSCWVRAGGGQAAPHPSATVTVQMRLRNPETDAITMSTVLEPYAIGGQPLWTHVTGTVDIPAEFDGFQTVVSFANHAARGQAFVDDVSVIAEHTAFGLDATYTGLVTTDGEQAVSQPVPVRAGAWHTVSVTVGGIADVQLIAVGATGEDTVADVRAGTGWVTATGRMPDGAQQAAIAVTPRGGPAAFARAQLTETEHHMPWHPGAGVPAVAVTDGYEHAVTRIHRDGRIYGDYSFTLTEVAAP